MNRLSLLVFFSLSLLTWLPNRTNAADEWQFRRRPVDRNFFIHDLAYGNGIYLARTTDYLLASTNGVDWEQRRSPSQFYSMTGLAYGKGRFVLASLFSNYLSTDGVNWSQHQAGDNGNGRVVFGNGIFAIERTFGRTITSTDGQTWSPTTMSSSDIHRLRFAGTIFFLLGLPISSRNYYSPIYTSADARSWRYENNFSQQELEDVAFGNGIYVVVGDAMVIGVSPNGTQWSGAQYGSRQINDLRAIAFGNGRFKRLARMVSSLIPLRVRRKTSSCR